MDASGFVTRRNVGRRCPLLPEILDKSDLLPSKTAIFNLYSLVASVTPSEKCSVMTNRLFNESQMNSCAAPSLQRRLKNDLESCLILAYFTTSLCNAGLEII